MTKLKETKHEIEFTDEELDTMFSYNVREVFNDGSADNGIYDSDYLDAEEIKEIKLLLSTRT